MQPCHSLSSKCPEMFLMIGLNWTLKILKYLHSYVHRCPRYPCAVNVCIHIKCLKVPSTQHAGHRICGFLEAGDKGGYHGAS